MQKRKRRTTNFYGSKIKTGALSRQLSIDISKNIPKTILVKIKKSKLGTKLLYNGRYIKVTALLKKRVNFAINSKKWKK